MVIGVLWESNSAAYYRAIEPLRALERRGHEVVWPTSDEGEPTARALHRCEVVHVYRRFDRDTREVLERLAAHGVAITWDTDDDLSTIPRESPRYKQTGGLNAQRIHGETLKVARLARVVTTTSEVLAERYRRAGIERVEVIDNHVATPSRRHARRGRGGNVVIGWIAGMEHNADAKRLDIPRAFRNVLATHGEVQVECIGVDLGLPERYRHDPFVPFQELPKRMAAFDIGIAPLADIPFNRARSDIKLKEYAASGVPWLASPTGPYARLGKNEGGQLVSDGGWEAALNGLITRPRERRRLARKGRSWAKRQALKTAIERWEAVFAEARDSSPLGRLVAVR